MKISNYVNAVLAAMLLCACSSGEGNELTDGPDTPSVKKLPILISTVWSGIEDTRATDYSFESGDEAGLYVVNHNSDGTASDLKNTGNHVDNMKFTYNGTWTPESQIYWLDDKTHADFYLYYPYTSAVTDVKALPFNLNADQSSTAAYKAGDMMVGSTKDVAPTESAVKINVKHVMSQIQITLVPGNGFTDETLAAAKVGVKVNGVKTKSTVNLADGTVTATGTATSVTPLKDGGRYKALIVPQSVAEGNLITVNVDGRDFNLKKAFEFVGGTRHKFTVTLSKTSNGINVGIDQWEDEGIDNGGTAE